MLGLNMSAHLTLLHYMRKKSMRKRRTMLLLQTADMSDFW